MDRQDTPAHEAPPGGATLAQEAPIERRSALRIWLSRLEGPQTMGRGPVFWTLAALVVLAAAIYPQFTNPFAVGNAAYFMVWTFMAMGLGVVWGYTGALSFGQTAFFGVAGYGYGILTINFGAAFGFTWIALVLSVAAAGLVALLIGYFMFYGRIRGVFIGIVTLSVTLVFETFMAQTAGPQWRVGEARLNGFNGMSGMPPLTIPWPGGDIVLFPGVGLFYAMLAMVVLCYLGLRMLLNAPFGNVLVAIRENPERAEMLGYDIRLYQTLAFGLGGALAGLSGTLYTAWGQYITPSSMGLTAAALPIVWVAVGGRRDITATLLGTLAVLFAFQSLTIYGSQYALVVMGALLVFTVLVTPDGLFATAMERLGRLAGLRNGRSRR
jgi:branched-chain amino acid transport system permease protein